MTPHSVFTVSNRVVLSYLEIADNFSFQCKSNDHKQVKMSYKLHPNLSLKKELMGNIENHVKSIHGVNFDEIRENLTSTKIVEKYPVVSFYFKKVLTFLFIVLFFRI